jgi:hypothetical protein
MIHKNSESNSNPDCTSETTATSVWKAICESCGCSKFNFLFRIGIGLALFPHCQEELQLIDDRITFYEEVNESMSSCMVGLHYFIIIIETIFLFFVCAGLCGRLSASLLSTSICLHLIPLDENLLGHHLFKYPVYSLLFPILIFITLTGSGPYSIDALVERLIIHRERKRANE